VLQALQPQDIPTADYLSQRTGHTTLETSKWTFSGRQSWFGGRQRRKPPMLPQAPPPMAEGQTLIFSHIANRPVRAYLPSPKFNLPSAQTIDPASSPAQPLPFATSAGRPRPGHNRAGSSETSGEDHLVSMGAQFMYGA